jgi:hypothetical protein
MIDVMQCTSGCDDYDYDYWGSCSCTQVNCVLSLLYVVCWSCTYYEVKVGRII